MREKATIRLGQDAKLKRDDRIGEVIGLRRMGGTLYAELQWAPGWSTSAPVSKVEAPAENAERALPPRQ